ncbi:polyprenol monophosphomannose synthase [Bifidobacterium indicum]|uniref:polyprenol monophosphomannose synthase n=2 Tax=Bifidobacterium indicum TaxID=1691 RepID=UPI00260963D6|nr:polyprenol monophosphomannose synthase [uncultured Bifidobacterium sp.]
MSMNDALRKESGRGALVVMPTYQEVQNIRPTLGGLLKACPAVRVLVVDDDSPDGTGGVADAMAARDDRISVLHRHERQGLGPAYVEGFQWALARGYDLICEMDMDGSHRPRDMARVLRYAQGHPEVDLVIGSRRVPGGSTRNWPWYRDLISRMGSWYARMALGMPVRDMTAGLRAYGAPALAGIDLTQVHSSGYVFQVDMLRRIIAGGGRVHEVPIVFVDRVRGHSKMDTGIVLEAMVQVTRWGMGRILGRSSR